MRIVIAIVRKSYAHKIQDKTEKAIKKRRKKEIKFTKERIEDACRIGLSEISTRAMKFEDLSYVEHYFLRRGFDTERKQFTGDNLWWLNISWKGPIAEGGDK